MISLRVNVNQFKIGLSARTLYQQGGSHCSVVNRAYYSMLYVVFALLVPYHIKKGVDEDSNIIALFDNKFVKSNIIPEDMSKRLHNAYNLCQADEFQDFFVISREQAIEILNSSDKFIKTIEEKLSKQS